MALSDRINQLDGLEFKCLVVGTCKQNPFVAQLVLNRPDKGNAFNTELWEEFPRALEALDTRASSLGIRVVLLSGEGRNFCTGIDTQYLSTMFRSLGQVSCPGRMREQFRRHILKMQDCFTALERCRLPVVAAIHGSCVGGGVDLVTACDIRLCSEDAVFCVKEVDLAIVADLGTLQRLPGIIGHGPAMDLCLTARSLGSSEALRLGLVTEVHPGSRAEVLEAGLRLAAGLAAKPPLALIGTKAVLLRTRDTAAVRDSLDYVATWNSAQLVSEDMDVVISALARKSRTAPTFSKL